MNSGKLLPIFGAMISAPAKYYSACAAFLEDRHSKAAILI
jgi:hypothetical protein